MLKLHDLRPAPGAHKAKQRLGRGEGSKGKTAGRGTKGTKARYQVPVGFEGGQMPLQRRLPKLKGFSNALFKTEYQVVNIGRLAELFPRAAKSRRKPWWRAARCARASSSRCSATATFPWRCG